MRRPLIAVLSVSFTVAVLALAPLTAAAAGPDQVRFDLADGTFIVGFRYAPPGPSASPTLIMIHGASDTHTVFDFTAGFRAAPELAQVGFPVLALDRVGYGASSHPDGDTLTFATSAGYVHEVIAAVRSGALGSAPPRSE